MFTRDFRTVAASLIPTPKPNPMIGPMSGEINIAPITTAVESTFNPMLAITMEKDQNPQVESAKFYVLLDAIYGRIWI